MSDRKARRSWILFFALLAGIGTGGSFLSGLSQLPPATGLGPAGLAGLLPEATLAYVEADGRACRTHGSELAIARIWKEPEVRAALVPLEPLLSKWLDQLEAEWKRTSGLTLRETVDLLGGRMSLGVLGMQDVVAVRDGVKTDVQLPDLVVAIELGEDLRAVKRLVEVLETVVLSWGEGTFDDATVGGFAARHYRAPPKVGVEAWYLVHESSFLLSTRLSTLEGVLVKLKSGDRSGTLGGSVRYSSTRSQVVRPASVLSLYIDLARVQELLAPEIPDDYLGLLEVAGIHQIEAIGYGLDLEGRALRDRLHLRMPADGTLAKALRVPGAKLRAPALLPDRTGFAVSFLLSPEQLYDHVATIAEAMGLTMMLEAGAGAVGERAGCDLRKELLPALGPEFTVFASWPGQALVPDIGVMVQVRDAERATRALESALEPLAPRCPISESAVEGVTVTTIDLSRALHGSRLPDWLPVLRPTWAVAGGVLVATPWPNAAKNLVSGIARPAARLKDRASWTEAVGPVAPSDPETATTFLAWADLPSALGFVLDNGIPVAQTMLPRECCVDAVLLPTTGTVTRHMVPAVAAAYWDRQGFSATASSPTSVLLPAIGASLFVRWQMSRYGSELVLAPGEAALLTEEMPLPPQPPPTKKVGTSGKEHR